ncbi:nuclear transport factor 2 family protein [Candidatus Phyllobacterium onerii]|uniref:nuclear transport factor 2 family protein n=1 Tax=Candidatus Phyllobacterium onerii TaxID=3020828 RepID=UPI00232E7C1D|nr:nuclear transport factor 2 family protein [Phyllobacterium sp. IY22]
MARRNSVEIVERFWREVWQSKNLNAIDDLVIEDFAITSSGGQIETRDAFKKWVAAFLSSINDAGGCWTPYDNRPRAPVVEARQAANDRASSKATITLADDLTVNTVTEASIDNIKEGDFVGIANVPDGGGTSSALEVVIFPAALKGTGEGDYAWYLKPNSSMTNATVANAVKGVDGRTVTVTYRSGQKKIAIPDNTPIVALAAGKADDLKAGAALFIAAVNGSDGKFTAHRVIVGTDGVVPPM